MIRRDCLFIFCRRCRRRLRFIAAIALLLMLLILRRRYADHFFTAPLLCSDGCRGYFVARYFRHHHFYYFMPPDFLFSCCFRQPLR
jgi:hypothetical protein